MNDDEDLDAEEKAIRARLADLRQQHQDLDAAVAALESQASPDMIQIMRLKKRKLSLRDEMSQLEDQITPDIIA
jgi:hypothetical protein